MGRPKERSTRGDSGGSLYTNNNTTSTTSSSFNNNPKPTRTAMGEYIIPPGAKALTSLGDCLPAPSDYSPKVDLTKPAAPHYSVTGPYKASKTVYDVSPADHDTTPNLTWRNRSIGIKGKGKMKPYDIRADAEVNDSVGPLQYRVEHLGTGQRGPKFSITPRRHHDILTGPPSRLVQPVDTHGTDTPGPNYRPNSGYWRRGHEKSFGSGRRQRVKEGPGPAEYNVDNSPKGLAYTLAKRLPPSHLWQNSINTMSPGPGAYDLGTTIGRAQAKSMGDRPETDLDPQQNPAPNLYSIPDSFNKERYACTLNYGWCEPDSEPGPSPTSYTVTDVHLKRAPAYSMSKQARLCFPEIQTEPCFPHILTDPLHTFVPGPGRYESEDPMSSKGKRFVMGMRAKTAKNEVPGPNHYMIPGCSNSTPWFSTPPAFSMGRRVFHMDKRVSPGPAAYNPLPPNNASGHSMTKRPKQSKRFITPGPNCYTLSHSQTVKGVFEGPAACLKSRASPYVYSGLEKAATICE